MPNVTLVKRWWCISVGYYHFTPCFCLLLGTAWYAGVGNIAMLTSLHFIYISNRFYLAHSIALSAPLCDLSGVFCSVWLQLDKMCDTIWQLCGEQGATLSTTATYSYRLPPNRIMLILWPLCWINGQPHWSHSLGTARRETWTSLDAWNVHLSNQACVTLIETHSWTLKIEMNWDGLYGWCDFAYRSPNGNQSLGSHCTRLCLLTTLVSRRVLPALSIHCLLLVVLYAFVQFGSAYLCFWGKRKMSYSVEWHQVSCVGDWWFNWTLWQAFHMSTLARTVHFNSIWSTTLQ